MCNECHRRRERATEISDTIMTEFTQTKVRRQVTDPVKLREHHTGYIPKQSFSDYRKSKVKS